MVIEISTDFEALATINGMEARITPYVGLFGPRDSAQLCVGFRSTHGNGMTFHVPTAPARLLQTWRAMIMITWVPEIESDTVAACWHCAAISLPELTTTHVEHLVRLFGSREAFEAVRKEVTSMAPAEGNLTVMLRMLLERQVIVDADELSRQVSIGVLPDVGLIKVMAARQSALSGEYTTLEEFIDAPMDEPLSLGTLLASFGIMLAPYDGRLGRASTPYDRIQPDEIDRNVKERSVWGDGHPLPLRSIRRTPKHPKWGVIARPTVVSIVGNLYTFLAAAYKDGKIMVTVHVEHHGSKPEVYVLSVAALRERIMPASRPLSVYYALRRGIRRR